MQRLSRFILMTLGLAVSFAMALQTTPALAAPLQQVEDLSISKDGPLDIDAGEEAFFEVSVCNQGTVAYSGDVVFEDLLPAEFVFLDDDRDACALVLLGSLECEVQNASLSPGQCIDFTLKTRAPADLVTEFGTDDGVVEAFNTVNLVEPAGDDNPNNDSDTHGFFVQDSADLMVMKVAESATVAAGEPFTYRIFVDNWGPSFARNVRITDDLISSEAFAVTSASSSRPGSCSVGSGLIECVLNDPLETIGHDSGTGRWEIVVEGTANEAQTLTNKVRVYTDAVSELENGTPDPDLSNNVATAVTEIYATADLRVNDFSGTGSTVSGPSCGVNVNTSNRATAGLDFRLSMTVVNQGTSTATNVMLDNYVPVGTYATDVDCVYQPQGSPIQIVPGWTGTPGDPNDPARCVFAEIPAGRGASMSMKLQVDPAYVARFGDPQIFGPQTALLTNRASASADQLDPDLSNNVGVLNPDISTHGVPINAFADLQVFVNDDPDPVRAGEDLTYEVIVNNAGPSLAEEVTLIFGLPAGVTFLDAQVIDGGSDLACTLAIADNLVVCELGDIEPGDLPLGQRNLIVNTRVNSDVPDGATLTASATAISYQTPDCNLDNNDEIEEDTQIVTRAEIEVRKSSSPLNPVAGRTFLWTYEVTNNGPSDAFNVLFTDTLPQGTTSYGETVYFEYVDDQAHGFCSLTSTSPDQIACRPAGTAFTNPPFVLPAGESVEFSILVRIDERMPPGRYTNTAAVSVGNSNVSITRFVDDVEVRSVADLKISKFVSPHNPVRAGEQFTYTILVDNLGPSTAYNIVVTDTLIASGFVEANGCSISVETAGGLFDEFDCTFALATGVFDLGTFGSNHLNPRSPTDMGRITITVNLTADEAMDLTNVTTVTSDSFDPNTDNNMAMVAHSVSAVADLTVTKTAMGEIQVNDQAGLIPVSPFPFPEAPNYALNPDLVTAGRLIEYTIEVTNEGPSTAENVYISDRLPTGVTVLDYEVTGGIGDCTTGTPGDAFDQMVCGLGNMIGDPGVVQRTVTILARVDASIPPGSVLENDVYVSSDIFEPQNRDNRTSTLTTVNTWADMEITKLSVGQVKTGYDTDLRREILEDLPGQVTAGHELRYELTVQNNGPSLARNVQVLDLLPGQSDTGLDHDPVTFLRADGAYCRPADELQEIGVFNAAGGKFGQVLWCSLGNVAPGERVTFDIYVQVDNAVPDGTTLENGAFVWWGDGSGSPRPDAFLPFPFPQIPPALPTTPDPFLDNNFASTDTDVTAVADVWIQKVDVPASSELNRAQEPDLAIAGNEHRYLIEFGNYGWSVARDIAIQDFLDFKQFGILGENFLRCEPFDIDDFVACSEANGVVDVDLLLKDNEQIVPGDLNPGDAYRFYLITEVDPGYVLDADDFIATNDSRITTTTTDFHTANNVSAHDTLIVAEADLAIEKTDIFGDPLVDPDNYFLMCDPVEPGGMITYNLTVTNNGPSDAADVYVVDWLPADYVVVDPEQVDVTVSAGEVVEVRDDGRITVRLGNDVNNAGAPELGRLNRESTETVTIQVMVRLDAECGGVAENRAYVETRQNDEDWPPAPELLPGIGGGDRTPTRDPDPTNNAAVETTTIECPKIHVNKTVSFNGQCPGRDISVINETGQPVTFCYEITNTGTTYLDTILITDTLETRTTMPTVIFTDTITFGVDPKLPVAPGETVLRQVTVPQFSKECGLATNTVVVSATPVNSGRTILPCLAPVTAEDTAVVEVPCAGVDWRVALPYLGEEECEAWLQVQNVGDADTKALIVIWGEAGFCPPQAAGPLKVECSGLLRPGSAWSFAMNQLPQGARSAIAYSMNASNLVTTPRGNQRPFADVACDALFQEIVGSHMLWAEFDLAYRLQQTYYGEWDQSGLHQTVLDFAVNQGEPLVVSVNRSCPDAADPNAISSAAYSGLSRDMLGVRDPASGAYMYYAPLIFASNAGLNTMLRIQNAGDECTSLEIWLKAQDNCLRPIIGDILTLSPGETVSFDPNTVVGPDWLGSAWIRATQPIAMVVDSMGANHFTSYVGVTTDNDPLNFTVGNQVSFAPLIYSEYQGWDTAIQVQNLSPVVNAKVKVYFLDRSGDVITTLVDWICPRGSQTFFLPTIAALGGNWVGSARIESQDWWTPGTNPVDYPRISSVVLLEKWSDPARTTRREAVAYNGQTECLLYDWQVGSGKGGTQSGSAVFAVPLLSKGNRGVNSELAITNLVAKPGFTDFAIFLYDQNGLLDFVCEKLHDRQVEYIDLATWGYVPPNFLGSAVVSATFWEHDVFDPNGGFVRNLVGLGGVVVERIGSRLGEPDIPGDESKAFEAIPVFDHFGPDSWLGQAPGCPGQPGFGP